MKLCIITAIVRCVPITGGDGGTICVDTDAITIKLEEVVVKCFTDSGEFFCVEALSFEQPLDVLLKHTCTTSELRPEGVSKFDMPSYVNIL
ncbi:MAG: hypothetical protein ACI31F_02825 [Muribaculaceae bacterium]